MQRKRIIALNIHLNSFEEGLTNIINLAKDKVPSFVCFVNAHMMIEAYWDKKLASSINNAHFLAADGMPVAKAIKFVHKIEQPRISGMDSFPKLLKLAAEYNLNVFLFGSTNDVLEKIAQKASKENPRLNFCGIFSPPFDQPINAQAYIDKINQSNAHLVFVALGCPKQEKWMADNSEKINAVLLGVGGAFPVYAGTQNRAPDWMQNYSLEWLYRFLQEPGRLWKRYLITNSLFVFLVLKQKLSSLF